MLVCTVATERTQGLATLERSCRRSGIALQVFGMGKKWRGFGWRQRTLYWNLVKRCLLYDYALVVDGYDTVFTAPISEIVSKFRDKNARLLFGAEVISHPLPAERYPASTSSYHYRYLNAGGFMGELLYVVQLMTALKVFRLRDDYYDQELYAKAFVGDPDSMALDHDCEIFQCLFFAEGDLVLRDGRPVNTITGRQPCIVHANGGSTPFQFEYVATPDAEWRVREDSQ